MAGYESATHRNTRGDRLDMIAGVQHDVKVCDDYRLLRSAGIETARDSLRWHLIDQGNGTFDFSSFEPMLRAAQSNGIQVIWDLCHYGFPDGIDLLKPEFVDRFGKFARAVARFIREHTDEVPFYSPMNEINFFSWGAARDLMYPYAFGKDDEIKLQLCRAAIEAANEVRGVDSRARLSYPEPTIHVLPPRNRPDLAAQATAYRNSQFDAWDIMAGRLHPELGGRPELLDIAGSNFYHSNQWEIEGNGHLRWHEEPRDERWMPYHQMLREIWERYRRPVYVAETSHIGIGRAKWITEIAEEVEKALALGVLVEGICLYPILDRYDWQEPAHWHNSGLWDLHLSSGVFERVLNEEYGEALATAQTRLARILRV